jgi:hypothetical protein
MASRKADTAATASASPPRAPRAAPTSAPPGEAALYAPDPDAVTIDGQRFRIGKMRIGPSLRFTELAVRLMARGEQAMRTMMTMNGTERETAGSMLSILTLLPESDLAELVAIAISNDDAVDRAWVIEHWDLEWVLPLLAQFTATNPLGKYFEPLGKVLMNLQAQMPALQTAAQAPAPQANGTTPSASRARST